MPLASLRVSLRRLAAAVLVVASFAVPAVAQTADTDSDTMPDAWETFFGLNPASAADATADPDGDGLTNAQEYAAGRHPIGRFARYFAEGSTGYFDTSLAVLNLHTADTAHVSIALLDETGGVTTHRVTLAPRGRQSIALSTIAGAAGAVSIIVESDVAVAADRAMTWGASGVGLSLDSGAPAPATTWYFAEGATGPFLLYYLFENPGAVPATVTVRYLREGDTPIARTRTLPPHSRTTVFVNAEDPGLATASMGAVVTADQPILAERAMYLTANGTFAGGSASSGASAPSTQWYFGEGATGPFFHAFLSLLNPGLTPATATVTYHLSDGSITAKDYTVPAEGRRTVYFNDEATTAPALAPLANGPVWFTVNATQPIVGERAMWWSQWPWYEGHAAIGSTASDVAWGVAEGRSGGPGDDQTYVLVGNTTASLGQVRVTLIPDAGAPDSRDLTIAPGARLTINVGALFGLTSASRFSVTVESIGTTPVPLAVDYARYRSVGGVPFSGGGAAPAVPLLPADTAPSVTVTLPAAGATNVSSTDNLVVTFSEPVNAGLGAFSLACPGGTPIGLSVLTASPATQFTLDPGVALPPSTTCTLTVLAVAITDVDSTDPPDVMTANAVVSFTTAVETAPSVSATTPISGGTQVGLAATLAITFTEPVTVTGNWFQIACGTSGTRGIADAVVTGGPTTFTIDPVVDFAAGETCTVTVVGAQVSDQDPLDPPDTMAANHVFAFTVDVAPTVTSTLPANGATQVGTAQSIQVTFSEPVDLTGAWLQVNCTASGSIALNAGVVSGGPSTYVFDPVASLAPGETCTVTVVAAQVTDQDTGDQPDAMAANSVFSFTTDVAPTVLSTTPADNATNATTTGNLTVTFSEPVTVTGNWFSIICSDSGARATTDTVVTGGPTTYTIDPNADFVPADVCILTIDGAAVTDQDAGDPPDAMAANTFISFTVDAQPSVTAITPASGATIASDATVAVTFSEPVTLNGNWFQIVCGTSGTRDTSNVAVTGGPSAYTINPTVDFAGGESCTLTVFAAQVSDNDGADPPDTLAANATATFTVDAAPTVTSTTPANGAAQVALDASPTVTFSEPVTATGSAFSIVCTSSGSHTFALSGGPTAWTINPDADFTEGETCTITVIAATVADTDTVDPPDAPAANYVFSFTVDQAPTVTATTPANGASQIASNSNLTVSFSEAVDVTGAWFGLVCTTTGAHTATVSGGPTTFTLNPDTDFADGESCTVTIVAAQVSDQDTADAPDRPAADYVFSFTVDTAPTVVSSFPTDGATGVAVNANASVVFSEPVNVTGSSFTLACGGAAQTFTVVPNSATTYTLDPLADFPVGTLCTVTVLAAQVSDVDAGDPPDGLAADYVFTFAVPPDAVDDARGATGNVPINTANTAYSVLANDLGPGIAVSAADTASARGGTVLLNPATGFFTYTPPVGYEGPDSFGYTISNAAGSDTGTVSLTVAGMIWFVDNSAAACTTIAAGCGRLGTPFSTLASFDAVNGGGTVNGPDVVDPEAGDAIFIATGAGSYAGPLTLEASQRVVGQGATSTVATLTGITFAADSVGVPATFGTKPTITSGGAGIMLAANDQLHGLAFTTAGTAVSGVFNVGTFTMSDIAITNTSGAGVSFTGGGTVTATGVNTVVTTTATALNVSNTTIGAGGLTFRSINVDGSDAAPVNGIVLSNTGSLGGLSVTGTGGGGSGGTIRDASGDGILLTSTEAVSLASMAITSNLGNGIGGSNVHGFVLNGVTITDNGDDAAADDSGIDLAGLTGTSGGSRPTSITNSTISNNHEFEVQITNSSGTLGNLVVTGTNMSSDGLTGESNQATGDHGNLFNFLALGTATMNLTVSGGSYTGNAGVGCEAPNDTCTATAIHADASGGTVGVDIGGVTATNNNVAVNVSAALGGVLTFDVHDNTATNNRSHGLNLFVAANATGDVSGFFRNNVVGTLGVAGSGSEIGYPIRVQNEADTGTAIDVTVQISGNQVQESASFNLINVNQGITGNGGTASPTYLTITNNLLQNSGARGITFQQNNNNGGSAGISCANIANNTFAGTFVGQAGDGSRLRLRQLTGGSFGANQTTAAGFAGANAGLADVQVSIGGTLTPSGPCPTP